MSKKVRNNNTRDVFSRGWDVVKTSWPSIKTNLFMVKTQQYWTEKDYKVSLLHSLLYSK